MQDSPPRDGSPGRSHSTDEVTTPAAERSPPESEDNSGKNGAVSEHSGVKPECPVSIKDPETPSPGGSDQLKVVEGSALLSVNDGHRDPEMPSPGGSVQLKVVEGSTLLSANDENRDPDLAEKVGEPAEAGGGAHTRDADASFDERFNSAVSIRAAQNPSTWFLTLSGM